MSQWERVFHVQAGRPEFETLVKTCASLPYYFGAQEQEDCWGLLVSSTYTFSERPCLKELESDEHSNCPFGLFTDVHILTYMCAQQQHVTHT